MMDRWRGLVLLFDGVEHRPFRTLLVLADHVAEDCDSRPLSLETVDILCCLPSISTEWLSNNGMPCQPETLLIRIERRESSLSFTALVPPYNAVRVVCTNIL